MLNGLFVYKFVGRSGWLLLKAKCYSVLYIYKGSTTYPNLVSLDILYACICCSYITMRLMLYAYYVSYSYIRSVYCT